MPAPITVTQPAELLPLMFATWTDVKKKQVRTWLKNQAVTVNGRAITQFNHALKKGDVVEVRTDRTAAPDSMLQRTSGAGAIKVRHEDDTLIVIEKPSGLLSIANDEEREKTAYFLLNEYLREKSNRFDRERVWIVHRLDRETSGLMVFAKTEEAKRALQEDWEHVEKQYFAVVDDSPLPTRPARRPGKGKSASAKSAAKPRLAPGAGKATKSAAAADDFDDFDDEDEEYEGYDDFDDEDGDDDDDGGRGKAKLYLTRLAEGSGVPGPVAAPHSPKSGSVPPAASLPAQAWTRQDGPPRTAGSTGSLESYLDESHPFKVRSGKPGQQTRYALTHYKVLKRKGIRSIMELTLRTGRRHQIRVHLSECGWSILGDPKYGTAPDRARRLALHSCMLRFTHPKTKAAMEFTSPLPPELERLLAFGGSAGGGGGTGGSGGSARANTPAASPVKASDKAPAKPKKASDSGPASGSASKSGPKTAPSSRSSSPTARQQPPPPSKKKNA